MRILTLSALAACMAFLAPVAANAKSYQGEKSSYSYSGKYSGKKHAHRSGRKSKYRSGRRVKNRGFTNRNYKGGSGTSTSCLTSSAQNLLSRIRSQFGNVQIISTCRPGARIAGSGRPSKHASGQAIDFRVPGRKAEVVRWLTANHRSGGTMTYRDMDHVHVDVGSRFVALNRPSGRS
jgi:uncharacterized protein YcbK (DUF882 family)